MLDIKFLRENPDVVKQNIKNKFQDRKLPLVDEVIELDKEKFAKMSEDEKLGYRAIGLSLETKAVEEKMGVEVGQDMLDVLTKIKLSDKVDISAADLLHIMQTLKKNNITNMDAFAEYLTGKGTSDRVETGIALKEAIKDMEGIEDPQAYLDSMKNAVRQYEEEE